MPYKTREENIMQCRRYYRSHKAAMQQSSRARQVVRLYGITVDAVKKMAIRQDFKCLMCNQTKRLAVDHCHKTKKVRGLLCIACNAALGIYEKYQFMAEDYLRR